MIKKTSSSKVLRALTMGLATMITVMQPISVLAAEPDSTPGEPEETSEATESLEESSNDNQEVSDAVDTAQEAVSEAKKEGNEKENKDIRDNLKDTAAALEKVEEQVDSLDVLNASAKEKKDLFAEATSEASQKNLEIYAGAAADQAEDAKAAAEEAQSAADTATEAAATVQHLQGIIYTNPETAAAAKVEAENAAAAAQTAADEAKKAAEIAQTAKENAKADFEAAKKLLDTANTAYTQAHDAVTEAQRKLDAIRAEYGLDETALAGDAKTAFDKAAEALRIAQEKEGQALTAKQNAAAAHKTAADDYSGKAQMAETAEKEYTAASQKLENEKATLGTLKEEQKAAEEAKKTAEADKKAADQAVKTTQKAADDKNTALEKAEGALEAANKALEAAKKDQQTATEKKEEAEQQKKKLEKQQSSAEKALNSAKKDWENAKNNLKKANEELAKVQKEINKDQGKVSELEQAVKELRAIATQKQGTYDSAVSEQARLAGELESANAAVAAADAEKTKADQAVTAKQGEVAAIRASIATTDENGNALLADANGNLYQKALAAQAAYAAAVSQKESADAELAKYQELLRLYDAAYDAEMNQTEAESNKTSAESAFNQKNDEIRNALLADIASAQENLKQSNKDNYRRNSDALTKLLIQYKFYVDGKDLNQLHISDVIKDQKDFTNNHFKVTYGEEIYYFDYVLTADGGKTLEEAAHITNDNAKNYEVVLIEKDKAYSNGDNKLTLSLNEDGVPVYRLNGEELAENQRVEQKEDGSYSVITTTDVNVWKSSTGARYEEVDGKKYIIDAKGTRTELKDYTAGDGTRVKYTAATDAAGNITVTKTTYKARTIYVNEENGTTEEIEVTSTIGTKDGKHQLAIDEVSNTFVVDGKTLTKVAGNYPNQYVDEKGNSYEVMAVTQGKAGPVAVYYVYEGYGDKRKDDTQISFWVKDAVKTFTVNGQELVNSDTVSYKVIETGYGYKVFTTTYEVVRDENGKEHTVKVEKLKADYQSQTVYDAMKLFSTTVYNKKTEAKEEETVYRFNNQFAGKGSATDFAGLTFGANKEGYETALQAAQNAVNSAVQALASAKDAFDLAKNAFDAKANGNTYRTGADGSIREQISAATGAVENLATEVSGAETQKNAAEENLNTAKGELETAEGILTDLQETASQKESALSEAQGTVRELIREKQTAEQAVTEAQQELEAANGKVTEATGTLENAQKKLEIAQNQLTPAKEKVDELTIIASKKEETKNTKQRELNQIRADLKAAEKTYEAAKDTVKVQKQAVKNAEKSVKAAQKAQKAARKALEGAQKDLEEKQKLQGEAEKTLEGAEMALEAAKKAVSDQDAVVKAQKKLVEDKKKVRDAAKKSASQAQKDLTKKAEALKKATAAWEKADAKKAKVQEAYDAVEQAVLALENLRAQQLDEASAAANLQGMQERVEAARDAYNRAVQDANRADEALAQALAALEAANEAAGAGFRVVFPDSDYSGDVSSEEMAAAYASVFEGRIVGENRNEIWIPANLVTENGMTMPSGALGTIPLSRQIALETKEDVGNPKDSVATIEDQKVALSDGSSIEEKNSNGRGMRAMAMAMAIGGAGLAAGAGIGGIGATTTTGKRMRIRNKK